MEINPVIITIATSTLTAVFGAGIVLGVLKKTINGSVERISQTHEEVNKVSNRLTKHIEEEADADKITHERIASVEAVLNLLAARFK